MSDYDYAIVVLEAGGAGTTLLVLRLTRCTFDPDYIPTIQDYFEKKILIDNKEYTIRIRDTCGQNEMMGVTDIGIKDSQACIIGYSITSKASFDYVDELRNKWMCIKDGNTNIVLVGNNCDNEENRIVTFEEGKMKAKEWGVPFFETSARKDINTQEPFIAAIKLIIGKYDNDNENNKEPKKKKKNCNIC